MGGKAGGNEVNGCVTQILKIRPPRGDGGRRQRYPLPSYSTVVPECAPPTPPPAQNAPVATSSATTSTTSTTTMP